MPDYNVFPHFKGVFLKNRRKNIEVKYIYQYNIFYVCIDSININYDFTTIGVYKCA